MTEGDWDILGHEWRGGSRESEHAIDLQALRLVMGRRTRRRVLLIAAEVLLSVVVLWWTFTRVQGNALSIVAARIGVTVFTVSLWVLVWHNRLRVWRPLGETTTDYLQLMQEQLDASERSIRMVWVVLGTVAALWVPWVAWRIASRPFPVSELTLWLFFGLYLVAMLGGSAWYRRRVLRDRTALRAMETFVADGTRSVSAPTISSERQHR